MRYYAGLDVSLDTTSVCVVDEDGTLVDRAVTPTDPAAVAAHLHSLKLSYARVGFESMAMASWMYEGLALAGLPAVCIEARHAHGYLKNRINKTDRNDAAGIAEMMRVRLYRNVHIKTPEAQALRALLTTRKLLQAKRIDLDNAIGGVLRAFGLKVKRVRSADFAAHAEELAQASPLLAEAIGALLVARAAVREQFEALDAHVVQIAQADPICRRLMTAPGVGPIVAITYRVVIDVPERFRRSRIVGAHLGLTARADSSGKQTRNGRISGWGDKSLRSALYASAHVLLHPRVRPSALRDWGLAVAARRGKFRAKIAVARRLAVILHRMWVDGTDFQEAPIKR